MTRQHASYIAPHQQAYIQKRVRAAIDSLQHRLSLHNNALRAEAIIQPGSKKIKIAVIEDRPDRLRPRCVAELRGRFDLYWRGKGVVLHIPHRNAPNKKVIDFHFSGATNSQILLDLFRSDLPAQDPALRNRARLRPQKARVSVDREDNASPRTAAGEPVYERRAPLRHLGDKHRDFLRSHLNALENKFKDRFARYFNDVSFDCRIDEGPDRAHRLRLDMRFHIKDGFRGRGVPHQVMVAGDLALRWQNKYGALTRLDFTPVSGLPSRNTAWQSLRLTREPCDVAKEIYNLLATAKMLVNTNARAPQKPAPAQPLPRRPHGISQTAWLSSRAAAVSAAAAARRRGLAHP